jgi:hypothetical protein
VNFITAVQNETKRRKEKNESHKSHFNISHEARLDLIWWRTQLPSRNGTYSMYPYDYSRDEHLYIATDASSTGYGTVFIDRSKPAELGYWLSGKWTEEESILSARLSRDSMPYKELRAIAYAMNAWGSMWKHKNITILCDCQPVVYAIEKNDSRTEMAELLRWMCTLAEQKEFVFRAKHIEGVTNFMPDLLSRGVSDAVFTQTYPSMRRFPSVIIPLTCISH